ncbi:unnamed protein product [Calicophoron daubneyi]|uniref:UDP-D-xylose:beta-D-glucoside alpha-1,3-D-xylosyltransferase n=1 Tax=Calicophoron daubneyi TaxID=300641 RepID=A0AAV2TBS0_CALDB
MSLNFYDSELLRYIGDYVPYEIHHPKIFRNMKLCKKFLSDSWCLRIVKPNKYNKSFWLILKLAWDEFLPKTVSKVITLDTDILLNQNIEKLWSHFSYFNSEQVIGGAYDMTDDLRRFMATPKQPMLGNGINAGVLLLHLERMRNNNWSTLWRNAVDDIGKTDKALRYTEQKVYNVILYRNPKFFYEIPCEWNIMVTRAAVVTVCPVAWVVGISNKDNCLIPANSSLRLAGLVHHTADPAPGGLTIESHNNRAPVKEVKYFRNRDLHTTFTEVYFAFLQMNKYCFF